jgi:large subunit ribosomal protein L5
MQVPKLEKIVLSRGVGAAVSDKKLIDYAVDELTKITGQKRYLQFQRKVASFKLRKGCRLVRRLLYVGKECMSFR